MPNPTVIEIAGVKIPLLVVPDAPPSKILIGHFAWTEVTPDHNSRIFENQFIPDVLIFNIGSR